MATEAQLALDAQDTAAATFTATFEGHKHDNPYDLWVALKGFDSDGVNRSASYSALRWNEQATVAVGDTCQVTVPKNADPAHPVATYTAYVWDFPDAWTPVSNTVTFPA